MIVYHWHRLVTHGDMLAGGCPKVVILTHLPFAVEMWAQMGQITTQLGRTLVPCCSTTLTVASLRVAGLGLGWLPSQAKLPLQDGWHGTPKLWHWP